MPYIQNTPSDVQAMLKAAGVGSLDELFASIPAHLKLNRPLDLPPALSELELLGHVSDLARRNRHLDECVSFLGAGVYDHFIPAVVDQLASRSEFYTSYTPYQPEVSQGVLQVFFEYQTLICQLTGMDVSNASMYDGASALAEAVLMACHIASPGAKRRALVPRTLHPEYRHVLRTYMKHFELELVEIGYEDGIIRLDELERECKSGAACVVVQNPNFFGCVEPVRRISAVAKQAGALLVACVDPISLGILEAPGAYGADIVVGDGQPLGNHPSFGGPHFGFMACRQEFVRKMPGRIVGETVDHDGRRGFVLTLQTREQHIRREKATSNICTSMALCALRGTVYLAALGKLGLRRVAELCLQKSHYLRDEIAKLPGFKPRFTAPFFKEFAVACP
ncbi:MAG: aminomethyl-transferring glycine dehydrogenase subunit GcvPA, partial [Planctomycetes bacterium]|nr:aminomethyl-transferring glycine dehydrogenase subunit GcvPA [Planctomycetota bacterium]